MINLGQDTYKDGGGHDVSASIVEVLGPYQHVADGFYRWTCGRCGAEHTDRACGWPISGQVMSCDKRMPAFGDRVETGCGAMNLLVRTNCVEIDEALAGKWRAPERDAELKRLRGVVELNERKVLEIKYRINSLVSIVLSNWRLPIEDQQDLTHSD